MVDTVVVNAEVHGHPHATSVAVTDERITAISAEPVAAGPHTDVIDAQGATLLPGFVDAHVHPFPGGLQLLSCDLSGLRHSVDVYADAIRRYASENPGTEWISGTGWYGDTFPGGLPTATLLDTIVPDRPAVLVSHDGHGVWANSRALERAGIDDRTPDPTNGRINRDADGRATGVLVERAGDLVTDLLPAPTRETAERALLEGQRYLHSLGITSWQDACLGPLFGLPDPFPLYVALAERGELTARVVGAQWWEPTDGLDQVERMVDRRTTGAVGRFRATTVKVMQDGICENCTGAMLSPYSGNPSHGTGLSFIDPEELTAIARALTAERFQIHLHAVGDRAVRECLDALEGAHGPTSADLRHQIAHLDVVDPADVPRFAELGVMANLQALWARRDAEIVERKLPLLGPEREHRHFPFGDLHRAGARFAMGSDWPVTSPNPLWAIHTAVTRTAPPEDPHGYAGPERAEPLEPEQALDFETALRAYTAGSAYANGMETEVGTIEVGKLADLVLLDRPVLAGRDYSGALPVLTMVGGAAVHRAD
ncbi:amidohydrolase [Nocardioides maradonensis]